jgi:hypothetical protein
MPPEALLADYPEPMRRIAEALRGIVGRAMPGAIERVRPGWRLIGYDVQSGRRSAYFCYVAPEHEHVHLGFEHGVLMRDPAGMLLGAGITRQVRWVTLRPGDVVDEPALEALVREAARVALLSRAERLALALEAEDGPVWDMDGSPPPMR